jgi:hypothetical protein
MRMNSQIDISDILSSIQVPTLVIHRTGDVTIDVAGGRYLSEHIRAARFVELPGTDHIPFVGENAMEIADVIGEFLTGSKTPIETDTVLATVSLYRYCRLDREGRIPRRPSLAQSA